MKEKLQPQYDLIFANILESILVAENDFLIHHMKPGSMLILSGLLKHQAKGIINLYSRTGLKLCDHVEKGDWAALLMRKEKL